ncbi:MAG: dihydropteroate synthase [Bryobacterales bacterium]
MGVVNVTPDSFSDGGRFLRFDHAVGHALELIEQGADLLDIGGESSRPGSDPTSEAEELERVAPVIAELARSVSVPLSIDTYKPAVAHECLRLGARIVNDISGLENEQMRSVIAEAGASAVLMHMRGKPKTMQLDTNYDDVVRDVGEYLSRQAETARKAGIADVAVDPGLGFGKTAAQNFEILRRLDELADLGAPLLVGPSRKSFLGSLPSRLPPDERLEGTIAACCAAALKGARILRVHDVQACKRALEVIDRLQASE